MIIALIILFAAYKIMGIALLVYMIKAFVRLWREKLVNDLAIQALALVVAINVFEWLTGWLQIEWGFVVVAFAIWHVVSLRKDMQQIETEVKAIEEKLQAMEMEARQ